MLISLYEIGAKQYDDCREIFKNSSLKFNKYSKRFAKKKIEL